MRGKKTDGKCVEPFDPALVYWGDYTEANAWHYTWFVPHDVPGLIELMGGDEKRLASSTRSSRGRRNAASIPDMRA